MASKEDIEGAPTQPAPMTIDGRPLRITSRLPFEPSPLYLETWRLRWPGRPSDDRGLMVSVYLETDCGREVEVSACAEFRPGSVYIDDTCARLHPEGPEVEIARETEAEAEQALEDAALAMVRDRQEAAL